MAKFSRSISALVVLSTLLPQLASAQLNTLAKNAGKLYHGSATDNDELTDTAYLAILSNTSQFGQITPGNSMKWDATEPSRGVFTFEAGDVIADLAAKNDQLLRGHNCVWYSQLPSWVSSGDFNASELTQIVENHTATVVGHYAGQAYSWDVVNEPLNDNGTFRDDVFYSTLGETYISIALEAARKADPNTKLYINEYNLEYSSAKSDAMVTLVKDLLNNSVPIDAIGFESHLIVGSVPTAIATQMELFTSLGLEVAVTELDIRMELPATEELLAQQKTDYETVINACASVSGCVGVTLWDYTDKYSWIPSTFPGYGEACPWDEDLDTKPAYDGIVSAWESHAGASGSASVASATTLAASVSSAAVATSTGAAVASFGSASSVAAVATSGASAASSQSASARSQICRKVD